MNSAARSRRPLVSSLALAALLTSTLGGGYGCARAMAQDKSEGASSAAVLPAGDREIQLTVYSDDFAMVHETRKVDINAEKMRIGLTGVSTDLDQNSVVFSWPDDFQGRIVSTRYDLGTQNSSNLLKRFLGREIELVYRGEDGREGERVKGILQVAEPGNIVVKSGERYIINPNATIEAPADAGIVTIPQLSAEVESKAPGETPLGVSYMTGGLSWSADYTATLQPDSDELSLECWATIANNTGTDFPNAKLSFVAGSPNRAVRPEEQKQKVREFAAETRARDIDDNSMMNRAFAAPRALGELYAYPYRSTATIRQDGMNRVRMMGSEKVRVKRVYTVDLPGIFWDYSTLNAQPSNRISATLGINFQNSEDSGLGQPLPGGALRIYEPADGTPQYVGAATIGNTPKNARVSLELSKSFDVYAQAKQLAAERIDKRHTRRQIEVELHNEKKKEVQVRVVQAFGPNWKITKESNKSVRLDSSTNEWKVAVPAGGTVKLRYSAVVGSY